MSRPIESLDLYLKAISRVPLLTAAEERELAERVAGGDEDAKRQLAEANLRFVVKIAKAYRHKGLPLLDLIQEGNVGLMEAINKFDYQRGFRLTTYAAWWIRLYIQRALEQKAHPVNIPINKIETLRKVHALQQEFLHARGRMPFTHEIAERLGLPMRKVDEVMQLDTSFISMESTLEDDGVAMERVIADNRACRPEESLRYEEMDNRLERAMGVLSAREKDVIERRYGLDPTGSPWSLRKIGKAIGLSAEGVRRIEEQALLKLRRARVRRFVEGLI